MVLNIKIFKDFNKIMLERERERERMGGRRTLIFCFGKKKGKTQKEEIGNRMVK